MSGGSWLDDLEAQLEARLDRFLQANPQQQALLEEQHRQERQSRLLEQRLTLQQQAQQQRQALLALAGEIRQWQERVERARAAGAEDLALKAEAHIARLMDQGRQRWQGLGELGQRFQAVEDDLNGLTSPAPNVGPNAGSRPHSGTATGSGSGSPSAPSDETGSKAGTDLDTAWKRFEAEQELDELRRRQRS